MPSKDATSITGKIGFILPLILIFLTAAADSAFACPKHNTRAAYRHSTVVTRTVSNVAPTVITYRAPASYRRCGNSLYDTRRVRYVAAHRNGYHNGSARYIAVRNGNGDRFYTTRRARYIAVRNIDVDDEPRYVAVRRHRAYVDDDDVRYVALRKNKDRIRYVAVREIDDDDDDDIRYIAVRRHRAYDPGVRYVAVRNGNGYHSVAGARYVAVRNINAGCPRPVALRRCLDHVETTSTRRVVLRNGNGYSTDARYVAVRNDIDDDDEFIAAPAATVATTKLITYNDDAEFHGNDEAYLSVSDTESPCVRRVAVRTCRPEAVTTRTVSYVPVAVDDDDDDYDDIDYDDLPLLNRGTTRYVSDDVEDACLTRVALRASPAVVRTRAVSYVPIDDVDDDAFLSGSGTTYIETNDAARTIRPVLIDDDDDVDVDTAYIEADDVDTDYIATSNVDKTYVAPETTYISADEVDDTCLKPVALRTCSDDVDAATVSYVPARDFEDVEAETISYVPAEYVAPETVSYVPVDNMEFRNVSWVPADNAYVDDTIDITADDCPALVSRIETEPEYVADDSTVLTEDDSA